MKNAWKAYNNIAKYDPFSIESLLKAHFLMSNKLVKNPDVFRKIQVNVYNGYDLVHECAKPEEIPPLMKKLFDWAKNSNINAIIIGIIKFTLGAIIASKSKKTSKNDKPSDTANDTVNDTVNRQIIKLIRLDINITSVQISNKAHISIATVKRRLALLKKEGIIERIGSDKSGYWTVKDGI